MYQLPYELSNDLENEKSLVKSRNWVHTEFSVQSPFKKKKFGNSSSELTKISS